MTKALSTEVTVRFAVEEDLFYIRDLYNDEILNTTSVYHYEARTEAQMLTWYKQKKANAEPILVAISMNKPIGFISYSQFRPWKGFQYTVEYMIHVHPDFQSFGVGKMLLKELCQIAKENGVRMLIGGVDSKNKKGIAFHKSMGFEEVGHLKEVGFKFEQWLDLLFFQLKL